MVDIITLGIARNGSDWLHTIKGDLYTTLLGLGVTSPVSWLGAWLTTLIYLYNMLLEKISLYFSSHPLVPRAEHRARIYGYTGRCNMGPVPVPSGLEWTV